MYVQSCCSSIASASAAAPCAIASIRFNCCMLPVNLHPLQLLLIACVRFSCCSQLRPFQLLPDCVRFGCCSPIASASAAALGPLIASASAAAPRLRPLRLLPPDCVRFGCCSPGPPASCSGNFWKIPAYAQYIFSQSSSCSVN